MFKSHKILALLIVTVTSGILTVLCFWLFKSYEDHRELTFAKADQALVATLNDYYNEHPPVNVTTPNNSQKNLADIIHRAYPNVAVDSLYAWMEQNATRRQDSMRRKFQDFYRGAPKERNGRRRSRDFNQWMFQNQNLQLSETVLDSLTKEYVQELAFKGVRLANVRLSVEKIERGREFWRRAAMHKKQYDTRPILINTENDLYLFATLPQVWKFIIKSMFGQIAFSFVLLAALVITFIALYKTIRKQNKLAILQRSFVTNMTHELKTPLSTVSAAVEALQNTKTKENPERQDRYLNISKRELEHLSQMVEHVLQFNGRGLTLSKKEIDLVPLVRELSESFTLIGTRNIVIQLDAVSASCQLQGDPAHLRNMLSNLIDNAIKYNYSENPTINLRLSEASNFVQIEVSDNGIGIPKIYQKDIYELFFRVPNGELYIVKGFGLGLTYVKQVVEQHKGSITVESEEGKGSTFTIKLPKI